jgi:transposase-like protein
MYKTIKVLNCLSKSAQAKTQGSFFDIWQEVLKADAEKACELFIKMYEPEYPKAAICLQKDRDEILAFYDFPTQHCQSIRTSNPIKSSFGTSRHLPNFQKGA